MDRTLRTLIALVALTGFVRAEGLPDLDARAAAAQQRGELFVAGNDGRRFLPAELRFVTKLISPDISRLAAPAVDAIADFAEQLKSKGISLLLVPVPPKAMFAAQSLGVAADKQQLMRRGWETIVAELRARGVAVEDLAPAFASAKEDPYCQRDTHWSGRGIALASEALSPAVAQAAGVQARPVTEPWKTQNIQGDLGGEAEDVSLRFSGMSADLAAAATHPVLLLGDSHLLVFHAGGDLHAAGAGLADQLASTLGTMPDVMAVRGSGATSARMNLARRARGDVGYLASKKLVVWCFAGRDFTEADAWKKIPILRPAPGR